MANTERKSEGRTYFGDLKKWQRFLIIIIAVGSISSFFIYYIWEGTLRNYSYENWERTTATVIRVQQTTGIGPPASRGRGQDSLTVEIEVNGEVFSNNYRIMVSADSVRRGNNIAVRFDPENPSRIVRDIPPAPIIWSLVLPTIFSFVVFLAIVTNFKIFPPPKRTFSMETNFRTYSNEELNAQLFEEILYTRPDLWDFMVIEPNRPIKNCSFLQVSYPQATSWPPPFILEISLGSKKTGAKMYRLTTVDRNIVLKHIIDYWQNQVIPDISSWEDVSYILLE